MTHEELKAKMASITDKDLVELCETELSKLCSTGGKSFTMTVPVRTSDTDMIFVELIRRFKANTDQSNHNKPQP